MKPELSVVIPVYKNASTVAELHRRLATVLSGLVEHYEILFVDDACPAGSGLVLRSLAREHREVGAISLAQNVGQNGAIVEGLRQARGQMVVVMDADLQDPPEAIPALVNALQEPYGAVFAGRRGQYERRSRLATSRLLKTLLHLLSQRRLPHDAGLFIAMNRTIVERIVADPGSKQYILGVMARSGLPLTSIPVERRAIPDRKSSYTSWMRVRLAARALVTTLGHNPRASPPSLDSGAAGGVAELIGSRFEEASLLDTAAPPLP